MSLETWKSTWSKSLCFRIARNSSTLATSLPNGLFLGRTPADG